VVLPGLPCEAAGEEARQVQGYGLGVPAARTPCDHQRKVAAPRIGID